MVYSQEVSLTRMLEALLQKESRRVNPSGSFFITSQRTCKGPTLTYNSSDHAAACQQRREGKICSAYASQNATCISMEPTV